MRQKVLFFIFLSVAVVAIVALFFGEPAQERLAGKPVGYWLDEMNEGGTRSNAALRVFLQAGPAAVPGLTNQLRFVPPNRDRILELKAHLPWAISSRLPRAPRINYLRRYAATYALAGLGPNGRDAMPALIDAVTTADTDELFIMRGSNPGMLVGRSWSHNLRAAALDAMSKIDSDGVDTLNTAAALIAEYENVGGPLATKIKAPVESAMRALEAAQNPSTTTVSNVLKTLREIESKGHFQRLMGFASQNVGLGGSFEPQNETNMIAALKSANAVDREAAAFEMGDSEREPGQWRAAKGHLKMSTNAVAALIEALQDREAKVRLGAAETLVKADEQNTNGALIAVLTELMGNTNSLVRLRAVDCFGRLGASAGILSDRLSKATNDNVGLVRVRARQALSEIGGGAAPKDKGRESF
jgi:hypothetical protein